MSVMTAALESDLATELDGLAPCYDIQLSLSVRDQGALWRAAALRLQAAGLDEEEIVDCIGPRDDVAVEDCLATLILPLTLAGCALTGLAVRNILPELSEILRVAAAAAPPASLPAPRYRPS
jgi:hypothetical protein